MVVVVQLVQIEQVVQVVREVQVVQVVPGVLVLLVYRLPKATTCCSFSPPPQGDLSSLVLSSAMLFFTVFFRLFLLVPFVLSVILPVPFVPFALIIRRFFLLFAFVLVVVFFLFLGTPHCLFPFILPQATAETQFKFMPGAK